MKNVEQNDNSPVEIIEGRLKRLRTNEIDARTDSGSGKKRVGGQENKGNLGQMEWIPLRKLRIYLADVEMIGST